jgi:tRNA dimethylallyltransferase
MQMYRGLPIITNQIPVEERKGIPHHLINCVGLEEEPWRISTFKRESLRLIKEIRSRGKLPILVGGTHYYTQAILFNDVLVDDCPDDEGGQNISRNGERENGDSVIPTSEENWPILNAPVDVMLEKLKEVDPIMAQRWHPKETRKIRRSLEIYFQTGKPASEIYAQQKLQKQAKSGGDSVGGPPAHNGLMRYQTLLFWVHGEKERLYPRLDGRVDSMIEQGLIAEARTMWDYLVEKESQGITVDITRGVWVSIGFKELEPYFSALHTAKLDENELETIKKSCIEAIKTSTRQYSVQQIKWIRNKLWTGLADAKMTHRLYLLDTSNVDEWKTCVTEPSERIVHAFLNNNNNEPCPDPKQLSELARQTLSEKEEEHQKRLMTGDDFNSMKCITCEVCRKTMIGSEQWDIHIHSYSHRRTLKAAAKRTRNQQYLRNRKLLEDSLDASGDTAL